MAKTSTAQQRALERFAAGRCIVCNTESRGLRRGLCITDYTRFRSALKQLPRDQKKDFERKAIKEGQLLESRQGQRVGEETDVFQRLLTEFLAELKQGEED